MSVRNPEAAGGSVTGGLYGVYIYPGISGGTVDNRYGVYIDDGGGTATGSDYGLYQAATYEMNYFGGSVGIGTTAPGKMLEIYNGTDNFGNPTLRINGGANGNYNGTSSQIGTVEFYNNNPGNLGSAALIVAGRGQNAGGSSELHFFTSASSATPQDRMVIDKNGNVGIGVGTTAPFGIFHVRAGTNNNFFYTGNADMGTPTMVLVEPNDAANTLEPLEFSRVHIIFPTAMWASGRRSHWSNWMRIGTTIATASIGTEDEFHITRLVNGGVAYPQLAAFELGSYPANGSGNSYGPATRLDINLKAAANNTLSGDATTVMTLLESNGYVGIGTTKPRIYALMSMA